MLIEKGWSEKYNALPRSERVKVSMFSAHFEIAQLEREKSSLLSAYKREVERIDRQIKVLQDARDKDYREYSEALAHEATGGKA
jgi:hypothetical protein